MNDAGLDNHWLGARRPKDEMATEVLGVRFQRLLQRPLSGERDVCNGSFARRRAAFIFRTFAERAVF